MKMNFIKDKEINLNKDDLLGAKPYVNTLEKIIIACETPFTIGLFGGWGVGKSSIIRTIKEKFNEEKSSQIKVFSYDAWKYANDSFRRTFLYELKESFNIDATDKFNSFYEDRSEDINHKLAVKKFSIWWWLMFSPLILLLIWILPTQTDLKITTTIISLILTIITTLLRETFVQYKVTVSKPKTFAPEQFEEIFNEVIDDLTNKKKTIWKWINKLTGKTREDINKVVIVIDNIDRCHKDLAFELLLTIKNFLEQENVIFIIPIDESEIKNHIESRGNDPNEFLRKLFNTTIYIKKISEGDLFDFAKKLNEKYNLSYPVEVISIVSQEFSKNPRKIIQFLNVLQAELALAQYQEESNIIPKKSISENLPFFTKLLIVREEWPSIYNKLKESPQLINNLHADDATKKLDGITLTNDQKRFFKRTEHIKPNHLNFELFFNNKDSFKDIPDLTNKLVDSNDFNGIEEQLKNRELSSDQLIEFIDSKFERAVRRGEIKTTIVNILSLVFQLSGNSIIKKELKKHLYGSGKFLGNFKNFINSSSIEPIILDLDYNLLLRFIKHNRPLCFSLKSTVVTTINKEEKSQKLLTQYLQIFKDSPGELAPVSPRFTSLIMEDFSFVSEIEDILSNPEIVENLINSSLIDSFIEEITNSIDDKDNLSRIKIVSIYMKIKGLSDKQFEDYLNKILSFIDGINDYEALPFWLKTLPSFMKNLNDEKFITSIYNSINTKQQWFWNKYNSDWNKTEYQESLFILLDNIKALYFITTNSNQSSSQITWLNNFFTKNESTKIILHINNIYRDIVKHFAVYNWPFAQNIINRFSRITEWIVKKEIASTLNLMLIKTSDEKGLNQSQILTCLGNYVELIDTENKETVIEWFSNILKNSVLTVHFRTVVSELATSEQLDIIGVLKKLKDDELIENVINETFEEIECDELDKIFDKLNEAEISKETIRRSIKTLLRKIEKDDENFTCVIEFLTGNSISDGVIQNLVAEKVKHLIVSDNKDEILFALKIIDKIQISDSRKSNALKTLIQDINKEIFDEDELKVLKKLEKKLR